MSSPLSPCSKDDLTQLAKLEELLSTKINWEVNTTELVQAYRSLVWLSGLKKKIEDSTAEILSVKEINKPKESE